MVTRVTRTTGLCLLVAILAFSGCDRHIASKDPVRSLPGAPPTPFHLTSRINDRTITLAWEVGDSSDVARSRIYRADDAEADFYLYDSSSTFSKVVTDLPFDRAVRLRVTTVNSSLIESSPSDEILVRVGLLSVVIQGDDEFTNDRDVQVRINVPAPAAFVELSEDPLFADASLQQFSSTMSFELSAGDGLKTVYTRVTFDDGLEAGEIVSDDITLDTDARIDSVYYSPTGLSFSAGDSIYFFVAAHAEAGGEASISFPGAPSIQLADDGMEGDATADDGFYSRLYIVPVGLSVADEVVTGSFTDAAGNSANQTQAADLLNVQTSTPPAAVTLAVGLIDTTTAQLTWTESTDADFASYRLYRSVSPGINVSSDNLTIAIFTDRETVSHDDYLPSAGIYYYRVFVFDTQDSTSGSNEVAVTR